MEFTVDFMKVYANAKQILATPATFLKKSKSSTWKDALVYFLIVSFVGNVITTAYYFGVYPSLANLFPNIFGSVIEQITFSNYFPYIIYNYFIGILLTFVWGAVFMVFVKLFGGKKDFSSAYKALVYSRTPGYLLSWAPVINIAASLYSLYILHLALKEYFSFSVKKSSLIVILGFSVVTLLLLLVISSTSTI